MSSGRYESSDSNSVGTAITFLLIGIGAGALAALVLAPENRQAVSSRLEARL